jgi:2-polyprenyl-6-methoxyphenol hydroxylase-like FAD-dependent oxidoreductase
MPFAHIVPSRLNQPAPRQHAIVIGGSIAGLLASRILADQFERVTLIERDQLSAEPLFRQGVPQGRHLHVLLKRGRDILEQLFPGFQDDLVAAGATLLDMAADVEWLYPAGWGVRFPSDLVTLSCSRVLLEWAVRQRVAALPQVQILTAKDVKGLVANAAQTTITGVELGSIDGSRTTEVLSANLVVDASGRRSKTPQWLAALGYAVPAETVIRANLGYASRIYQCPENFHADWKALYLQAMPPELTRGCVLSPIEHNRWIVTLMGAAENHPPTDHAGFLEFARSLRSPLLYDAIKDAEPLTPIYGYRATENRLRQYERLSRLPDNFVILGDAVCAFNPVYGQGMTMAAIGAVTLGNYLQQHPTLSGLQFQQQLAQRNTTAWQLATGEDCRYLSPADDSLNWQTQLMHRYVDQVVRLSVRSVRARQALLEVLNLVKSPNALFHPLILWQIGQQIYADKMQHSSQPVLPTLKREF